MNKRINIGLIGTGRLGSMYAEFLVQRVPQANLVAVADLIPRRAFFISRATCAALTRGFRAKA